MTTRTAQRWEKLGGIPIRRKSGLVRGRVFAYESELKEWLSSTPLPPRTEEDSAPEPAVATPSRKPWILAAASLLLALTGVLLWSLDVIRLSGPPSTAKLEGSTLRVYDVRGRLCWEAHVGLPAASYSALNGDTTLVADIDDDGETEVLFSQVPQNIAQSGGSLLCFSQRGRLRWTHHYGRAVQFGGRNFSPSFRGTVVRAVRAAGKPRVLAVANHYVWYPSRAVLLEPSDGSVVEEYWHPGAMMHGKVVDLDGDGHDEVVLAGINNPGEGIGHAAVAVLTLPFSRAAKPDMARMRFPSAAGGGERSYILLPLPDILRATGTLPIVSRLEVEGRRIMVIEPLPLPGGIVYYLDFDLRLLECRFSDSYQELHRRLETQGLLNHPATGKEVQALKRVLPFPAAPDGNAKGLEDPVSPGR